MEWIIGIIIGFLLAGLVIMLVKTVPISKKVYFDQLVRTSPEKWGRVCSAPENEEQLAMWNSGCLWAEENAEYISEVHIQNDGFDLYGEFFDFGSEKCVIILPGRCECLKYSYFYAEPYKKAGFNVLVVDTRCHGRSGGTYNTIGVKESDDLIKWVGFLEKEFGTKEIYFHGICIGSVSGLLALTKRRCPDTVKGMVCDGCFVSFRETFKRHMIADNRPLFPVLDLVMLWIKIYAGTNVMRYSPIKLVKRVENMRMLFLFGEKDIFSVPEKSRRLFNACTAEEKKLVWFEKGGHSHLRINNPEQYDTAITEFLAK